MENSCAPASDLLTKLTYLGLRCRFCTDAYLQQISAAHLRKGDVAVAFSRSGRSVDTVKALRLAKKAGAATIAVTGERTALLSRYADLTLSVGGGGQTVYGNAIFSRVADLAVVDMLYMGIILSDYERFSRNLDRSGVDFPELMRLVSEISPLRETGRPGRKLQGRPSIFDGI